jgi:hypothetical protein
MTLSPFIVLSQRLYSVRTAKLYNKKEIVSIIEEYSWVSYDVTEVNSKTKHSYQSESIVRFMY